MQGFGLSGSDLELVLAYDLQVFRFSASEVQLLSIPRTLLYVSYAEPTIRTPHPNVVLMAEVLHNRRYWYWGRGLRAQGFKVYGLGVWVKGLRVWGHVSALNSALKP